MAPAWQIVEEAGGNGRADRREGAGGAGRGAGGVRALEVGGVGCVWGAVSDEASFVRILAVSLPQVVGGGAAGAVAGGNLARFVGRSRRGAGVGVRGGEGGSLSSRQ